MTGRTRGLRLLHWLAAGLVAFSLSAPGGRALEAAPPDPKAEAEAGAEVVHAAAVAANGGLQLCGNNPGGQATTTAASFTLLINCQLTVAGSGHILVMANASVGLNAPSESFEANFRIGFDQGPTGDDRTDRYVDVAPDSSKLTNGDGTDRGVAITAFYTVTAGAHTINFLYRRTEGSGTVKVYSPSLNVLFVPDTSDLLLCGELQNAAWTNNSGSLITTVKCTINAPYPGLLFVSADGWMSLPSAGSPRYTSAHEIYLNNTNGGDVAIRYTDVLTNTGDGVDATVAATQVFTVSKGTQAVSLVFRREYGTGVVQMNDASIGALFVPDNSTVADACQAHHYPSWETSSSISASMAGCALTAAETSQVFVSGSLGVGLPASGTAVEGRFGLAYGGYTPFDSSVRYVNSYPDGGEGTDGSVATSNVLTVAPGLHTFYLLGARYAGSGAVKVWCPVLFVLVPRTQVFVPLATH